VQLQQHARLLSVAVRAPDGARTALGSMIERLRDGVNRMRRGLCRESVPHGVAVEPEGDTGPKPKPPAERESEAPCVEVGARQV